jgi:hypothetical protein
VTAVSDPDRRRLPTWSMVATGARCRLPALAAGAAAGDRGGGDRPYEAYRQAVRAELPGTRIVVAPFHLLRGAGQALDTVRRERQRGAKRRKMSARHSQRGSFRRRIFRQRHRLLRARERLAERERRMLCERFAEEPPDRRGRSMYKATERLGPSAVSTPSGPPSSARH